MKITLIKYLSLILTFLPAAIQAQNKDSIAAEYKEENAVITNYTEHLVIKNIDGRLVAKSTVTEEKLLISDLSPGIYNRDYVYHSSFNKLVSIDANSSLPSETGYKKKPCYDFHTIHADRDNVFYDDSRETVISFSGLVKNALTETKYVIEYTDLNMLPEFYFQQDLPILNASFEVTVPKYVNMRFVIKGENTSWIKQTKEETSNTITYKYTAADIPALTVYNDVPSVSYYIPHIIPFITAYTLPGSDKTTEMLSDPGRLYKYLYKYIRNLNAEEDALLDKTVLDITKDDTNKRQKAAHIYDWVQKNMHYVAFEDGLEGFIPRPAAVVCKRKYGDCKDMTSILVAMCRKAGLEAYFTWIGTREKPYTYEETPLPMADNHMICTVKLDDQWIFMDGTHPLIPFGRNPEGLQGKEALIAIDANNYKIITVPVTNADKNTTIDSTYIHISDKSIAGSVKLYYKGYKAWDIAVMMMYYKNEDREKEIKELTGRGSNKYLQTGYKLAVSDTGEKNVLITTDFTIDDYLQKAGKQYYVNMNLERKFEDNQVAASRAVPYFFKFKEKNTQVVVLDIPKGYHVSYLPPAAQSSEDGLWSYKISYKASGGKITLTKEYELKTLTAAPSQFAENNKMADDLKKIYKESVVLTAN